MPFNWSVAEEESKTVPAEWWKEYILISYKPLVSLILAALFILFVVRPMLRRRAFSPREEAAYLPNPSLQPALPPDTSPQPKSLDLKTQTVQLIQENPSRAVGIIKEWINEGKDA